MVWFDFQLYCYGYTLPFMQRIRATADGSERKYLMRDLNIIEKSKGCPYIVTFYGVLLKEVSTKVCNM